MNYFLEIQTLGEIDLFFEYLYFHEKRYSINIVVIIVSILSSLFSDLMLFFLIYKSQLKRKGRIKFSFTHTLEKNSPQKREKNNFV